ncbi:hypothetical protein [Candidatus Enterococcus ferrettii]|uniref:Mor transcription activator domain-containing protein n=1 Tax=Candidatus Enterococcus ferrettii TaxID=2815324 RepID=A0ABV0EP63_9ENTE|nr:hypothetical protein [Enterococcus sp. 665A]MBO1342704.1 hypothetical protein [Enterococcus sp. 665A]
MVEKELLNSFYQELADLLDEEAMLKFFEHYQGLVISVPKKLYCGKRLSERLALLPPIDLKTKQQLAQKYGYSQRQIERLIKKNPNEDFT